MSFDNDVRRLVRDLLRTGLDAERVLDLVLRELSEANSAQMLTSVTKGVSIHPAHHRSPDDASAIMRMPDQTVVRWTVEMLHVPTPLPATVPPPPAPSPPPVMPPAVVARPDTGEEVCEFCLNSPSSCTCRDYEPDYSYDEGDES